MIQLIENQTVKQMVSINIACYLNNASVVYINKYRTAKWHTVCGQPGCCHA